MELKKTNLKFTAYGETAGLTRVGKGYGARTGTTRNGKEYKAIRFDFIINKEKRYKIQCDIFGSVRDEIYYRDNTSRKVIKDSWEKRFELAENENNYVFPQPYDAAVEIEMAEDGDYYRLRGDLRADQFEKDGKTFTSYKFSPEEASQPEFEHDYECTLSGDFVFDKVKGNKIYGYTVDYKKKTYPITFTWGGDKEILDDIKNAIQFGTLCNITNGKAEMVESTSPSSRRSFGTSNDPSNLRIGFVLYGIDIAREEPYTAKDLGIYDDEDEELFK